MKQPQFFDRIDELRSPPSNVYLYTKDKAGTIQFSYKVKLFTFWAKYNPNTFEKQYGFTIKGYDLFQNLLFQQRISHSNSNNEFEEFFFSNDLTFNSISFSSNLIIDNLVIYIDRNQVLDPPKFFNFEKTDSKVSLEIQDMIQSFEKDSQVVIKKISQVYNDQTEYQKNNDSKPRKIRLTQEVRRRSQNNKNKILDKGIIKEAKQEKQPTIQYTQMNQEQIIKQTLEQDKLKNNLQKNVPIQGNEKESSLYDLRNFYGAITTQLINKLPFIEETLLNIGEIEMFSLVEDLMQMSRASLQEKKITKPIKVNQFEEIISLISKEIVEDRFLTQKNDLWDLFIKEKNEEGLSKRKNNYSPQLLIDNFSYTPIDTNINLGIKIAKLYNFYVAAHIQEDVNRNLSNEQVLDNLTQRLRNKIKNNTIRTYLEITSPYIIKQAIERQQQIMNEIKIYRFYSFVSLSLFSNQCNRLIIINSNCGINSVYQIIYSSIKAPTYLPAQLFIYFSIFRQVFTSINFTKQRNQSKILYFSIRFFTII